MFDQGVDLQVLQLFIVDDLVPEVAEEFCIQLFSTDEGVTFGDINSSELVTAQ